MIQGHRGCEPDQAHETEIHWMTKPLINAAGMKVAPWHFLTSIPMQPLGPSGLKAESGETDAVEQRHPRSIKSNEHHGCGCSAEIPERHSADLPSIKCQQQADTGADAEKCAMKFAGDPRT
jgi:hypothetical protein